MSIQPESVMLTTEHPTAAETSGGQRRRARTFSVTPSTTWWPSASTETRARCLPHISHAPGTSVYLDMQPGKLSLVPVD